MNLKKVFARGQHLLIVNTEGITAFGLYVIIETKRVTRLYFSI